MILVTVALASRAPHFVASHWSWAPRSHPARHTVSRDIEGVFAYCLQRIIGAYRVDRLP